MEDARGDAGPWRADIRRDGLSLFNASVDKLERLEGNDGDAWRCDGELGARSRRADRRAVVIAVSGAAGDRAMFDVAGDDHGKAARST